MLLSWLAPKPSFTGLSVLLPTESLLRPSPQSLQPTGLGSPLTSAYSLLVLSLCQLHLPFTVWPRHDF